MKGRGARRKGEATDGARTGKPKAPPALSSRAASARRVGDAKTARVRLTGKRPAKPLQSSRVLAAPAKAPRLGPREEQGGIRVLVHASELLTGAGFRAKDGRHPREEDCGAIRDGAVVYESKAGGGVGRLLWIGETRALPREYRSAPSRDLEGRRAVTAGWIDCHTHLVFAGDRSAEFAARCAGATYQEIAAQGGGIVATVRATREASLPDLTRLAAERLAEMAAYGVRTVEIKSGYGLSFEAEVKILETIPQLRKLRPDLTLKATFLGAHAFPKEVARGDYLREIHERMLPEVARRGLADACDVFIDDGYYTPEEGEAILRRARSLGLAGKIHADELANTESAALAARIGALSADHLLKISDAGIAALSGSRTVAVLLPGTAFYLKAPQAPARKLLDSGARVALSTDFNPGTSMCLSLPTVLTTAALYLGLSRSELLAAITYNAAAALGLESRKGTLEAGLDADLTVLPFERFDEAYYRFAWSPPAGPSTRLPG